MFLKLTMHLPIITLLSTFFISTLIRQEKARLFRKLGRWLE